MKKISLSLMAAVFAIASVTAGAPVHAKKAKTKQASCTSCPKGTKCSSNVCSKGASCCK